MSVGVGVGDGLPDGEPLDRVGDEDDDGRGLVGPGVGDGLLVRGAVDGDGGERSGRVVRGRDRSARDCVGDGRFGSGATVVGCVRDGDTAAGAGSPPPNQPGATSPTASATTATGAPNTTAVAHRGMGTPRRTL